MTIEELNTKISALRKEKLTLGKRVEALNRIDSIIIHFGPGKDPDGNFNTSEAEDSCTLKDDKQINSAVAERLKELYEATSKELEALLAKKVAVEKYLNTLP